MMYDYFTSVVDFLDRSSRLWPDKFALIISTKKYSYRDLLLRVEKLANFLQKAGVIKGDRVLLVLDNGLEAIISFWAVLKAGAVVSLIHPGTDSIKLDYIVKDFEPKVIICEPRHCNGIAKIVKQISFVKKVLVPNLISDFYSDLFCDFSRSLERCSANTNLVHSLDIDLASIIYTSGSTGQPKGVMLSHRNMLGAATSINLYLKHERDDIILCALPLSFDYGLYQMIMTFSMGATLVLESNFIWPAQTLKRIKQHSVTVLPVVPTMIGLLQQHNAAFGYDLSSIKKITNTGAALTEYHIKQLQVLFPQASIYSMYGLTECKRCTYLPADQINLKPLSVGVAIPNTELWIVDEQGCRLGPNKIGQLVVRGSTVMQGYWRLPEKTQEKLKPGILPNEKVLYTGDCCWLDDAGFLYFHGRQDEIIKSRGIKVSPKVVERILMQHPMVNDAAVFGMIDSQSETKLVAVLVCADKFEYHQFQKYCKLKLTHVQRPQDIYCVNSLPKNLNNKIDKFALSDMIKSAGHSQLAKWSPGHVA